MLLMVEVAPVPRHEVVAAVKMSGNKFVKEAGSNEELKNINIYFSAYYIL